MRSKVPPKAQDRLVLVLTLSRFSDSISHMQTSAATAIRAALDAEQRSQAWLASQLGISRNAMSRKLSGSVDFSVDEFLAAAAALHVDPSEVIKTIASGASAA